MKGQVLEYNVISDHFLLLCWLWFRQKHLDVFSVFSGLSYRSSWILPRSRGMSGGDAFSFCHVSISILVDTPNHILPWELLGSPVPKWTYSAGVTAPLAQHIGTQCRYACIKNQGQTQSTCRVTYGSLGLTKISCTHDNHGCEYFYARPCQPFSVQEISQRGWGSSTCVKLTVHTSSSPLVHNKQVQHILGFKQQPVSTREEE